MNKQLLTRDLVLLLFGIVTILIVILVIGVIPFFNLNAIVCIPSNVIQIIEGTFDFGSCGQ